jgi:NitT/TauT family transport system substrate-binding protein
MTRSLVRILASLAATAAIACFFACKQSDDKPAGPLEKAVIAYSTPPHAVLAQIALVQGYYLQEGLEAIPQFHVYGKKALDAVLEGKADFATVGETPAMFAIMKGGEISILATIQASNKNTAIFARKDKGILTPDDLKGRKIAVTFGTIGEFFMDAFLAVHGVSRKDLQVVNLDPDALHAALVNGDVDAVSTWDPITSRLQMKLGDKGIRLYGEDIYTQTFNIVATQGFVGRNPGMVQKMLRALIKAEDFVRENPREAQKIVADFNRMELALVHEIWPGNRFTVALDQSLLLALEDESRWAIHNGLVRKVGIPNYLDFIYLDGLASVNSRAIRILK